LGSHHTNEGTLTVANDTHRRESRILSEPLHPSGSIIDIGVESKVCLLWRTWSALTNPTFVVSNRCYAVLGKGLGEQAQAVVLSGEGRAITITIRGTRARNNEGSGKRAIP
jgi:hypothetical protein